MIRTITQPARRCRTTGLSLIESSISIVIVGVMFAAVLNLVGSSQATEYANIHRNRGLVLAQDLMEEILARPYWDLAAQAGMGPGAGEVDRMTFDDVDDYKDWSESPPTNRDATAIPWAAGYEREVTVKWRRVNNLNANSATETGIKWIRVEVRYKGKTVADLQAYRTTGWVEPTPIVMEAPFSGVAP